LVTLLEDCLSSLCDFLLEHLFVITEQELKPVAFSVRLNLNSEVKVDSLVLLFNVSEEIFCLIVKLEFLLECFETLEDLGDKHNDDSQND